jgi:hypothetical protein
MQCFPIIQVYSGTEEGSITPPICMQLKKVGPSYLKLPLNTRYVSRYVNQSKKKQKKQRN